MLSKRYKASEACKILGISRRKLGRMLVENKISSIVENNHHYFSAEELSKFEGIDLVAVKNVYLYSRVSSYNQKTDLVTQQELLENFSSAKGFIIKEHITDIGSGINFKRKGFLKLIKLVLQRKVSKIIITYEDRLARFAFDLLKEICMWNNCEIIVINNKTTSPQEELVEDLMTIIHVFSSRLYGLRRNKGKINELCRTNKTET